MGNKDIKTYSISVDLSLWSIEHQKSYEKSLLLFVTGKCNLNCKNCFSISTRSNNELSLDDIKHVIDANPSFERIDIMGGEPLLYSSLSLLIRLLRERNKRVSIYTNGLLLSRLDEFDGLRICVSFHEIVSNDPSRKPLIPILDNLKKFALNKNNSIKLVLLLDSKNADDALEIIEFVDCMMPYMKKLTIGLMRYENDYWNDNCPGVLSFRDYALKIQQIVDLYKGRLNLDIFLKGVLIFPGENVSLHNRVNRFQCVFSDMTYSDCLYNACDEKHPALDSHYKLPESRVICKHTGRKECLADKIHLVRKL